MDRKVRSPISSAVILVLLVCAGQAQAAGRESKERLARKACLSGELTKGVQLLSDLYLDTKDPVFIYNQARCFEQNNRLADAVAHFREYLLKEPDPSAPGRVEAQKHIESCQALLGNKPERVQPEVAAAPAAPVATPTPASAPTLAPEAIAEVPGAGSMSSSEAGSGLRTAGLVTAVVGGAALVAGLAFNLKANNLATDARTHYDPNNASSHDSYVTLSWIGYGAGAACLASGVVLYFLGWRAGHPTGNVALVPTVGSGLAGLALTGPL
jgi:hypothetical protein